MVARADVDDVVASGVLVAMAAVVSAVLTRSAHRVLSWIFAGLYDLSRFRSSSDEANGANATTTGYAVVGGHQ